VENLKSFALQNTAQTEGLEPKDIKLEAASRRNFLEKLAKTKVFGICDVHKELQRYCPSA